MASVRASINDVVSAAACDRMRLFSTKFCRDGAAITAMIATIANVISSSIRVKPRERLDDHVNRWNPMGTRERLSFSKSIWGIVNKVMEFI